MAENQRKIRLVIGKIGFDAHDRAVAVLSRVFRDAGMEVIFLGKFQTAEMVVRTAIEEDCDVIALSDHCGVMRLIARDVMTELKKQGAHDICVVAGGIIPEEDIPEIESYGVTGSFNAGSPWDVIVDHIKSRVREERWGVRKA